MPPSPARTSRARENQLALRLAKQKGFLDAMLLVEKAHVPTPNLPSIVYPQRSLAGAQGPAADREVCRRRGVAPWAGRKADRGDPEVAHDDRVVQTPLPDVIDYLKDLHKIEIQLDRKELESMSIGFGIPLLRCNLKGISLSWALRLLLDELGLKCVVHDEVLLITSPSKAGSEEFLTTKAYPAGDVVIPIRPPDFSRRIRQPRRQPGQQHLRQQEQWESAGRSGRQSLRHIQA